MSRVKPKRWSVRFQLAPENPDDVVIHEHLDKLAESNEVAPWIRRTLLAAIQGRSATPTAVVSSVRPSTWQGRPTPKPRSDKRSSVRYEKVEEE